MVIHTVNDACRASCVDWYGNARPLFVRGRVLALFGYEIVEGTLDDKPHPRVAAYELCTAAS